MRTSLVSCGRECRLPALEFVTVVFVKRGRVHLRGLLFERRAIAALPPLCSALPSEDFRCSLY